jgi:gas vesicle protein
MQSDIIGMKGNNNLELPCFMLGLGAGVALTLMCAPRSGDEIRRRIVRKIKDGEDWVKEQAAAAQESVTSRAGNIRDKAREVAEVIAR